MTTDSTPTAQSRYARGPVGWTILIGVLVVIGVAALEMSGSAQRMASTNNIAATTIVGQALKGQKVCQPGLLIPGDGAAVRMLIFTYNKPMPETQVTVSDTRGVVVDRGFIPPGGPQGFWTISFQHPRPTTGTLCIKPAGPLAFAGQPEPLGPTSLTVSGKPQPAAIAIMVMRPGSESWWQLLPTVARRFGYGKWTFLGSWTFVAGALALCLLWILALRTFWRDAS